MPYCRNDPSATYKGSEPSPKGLGWCAHAMKAEGMRKRGSDGKMWVTARRGRSLFWKRFSARATHQAASAPRRRTTAPRRRTAAPRRRTAASRQRTAAPRRRTAAPRRRTATPRADGPSKKSISSDVYPVRIPAPKWAVWEAQFSSAGRRRLQLLRGRVADQLKAAGVSLHIIPLPQDPSGLYWIDIVRDYVRSKYGLDLESAVMMPILRLGVDPKEVRHPQEILIQHGGIMRNIKKAVIDIMQNAFGKAFSWNGSSAQTMRLSLV